MSPGRRAIFLDRDGTLMVDREYLAEPGGVELLPGAADAVRRINGAGLAAVLVTNQSGIGRGFFGEAEYHAVHARLAGLLAAAGARLDAAYFCPLAPGQPDPEGMRKPAPGMFLRAAAELGLELAGSAWIGDRLRDVEAARALGGRAFVVRSAQTEPEAELARRGVPVLPSLAAAVERVLAGDD